MIKRCTLALFFVLLPVASFAQATRRYIVVTRQPAEEALRSLRNDDFLPGPRVHIRSFTSIEGFAADLTDDEVETLNRSNAVQWVEPVIERHLLTTDTVTPGQQTTPFGVNMVNAPAVWPVTEGKSLDPNTPIRVVVIDTGIRYTDTELKNAYKGGHNFIDGTDNPFDDHGHGTHVSGTIAAADDGSGVVGIAPQVELYGLKVLDQCGSGSTENIIAAIDWILGKKATIGGNWIANLSLGSDTPSSAEQAAFQRGADAGILFFAAAGNGYDDTRSAFFQVDGLSYPAGYPSVVSVGAIDSSSAIASFSQRGADLKVVAPGIDVLSTFIGGHVSTNDGQSFVCTIAEASKASGDPICLNSPSFNRAFVFCNFGGSASNFPASVRGKIALISRGPCDVSLPVPCVNGIPFADKVKNAKTAGAIGVILFDAIDEMVFPPALAPTTASNVLSTVFISKQDGTALLATPNAIVTVAASPDDNLWALLAGTSMATPHAAGVAALVWAVAPTAPATTIADAMIRTAKDLGAAGFDTTFGNGLVNALDAAKKLNPTAFGIIQPTLKTGRRPGRRGH